MVASMAITELEPELPVFAVATQVRIIVEKLGRQPFIETRASGLVGISFCTEPMCHFRNNR